jgi:hypothetical protein
LASVLLLAEGELLVLGKVRIALRREAIKRGLRLWEPLVAAATGLIALVLRDSNSPLSDFVLSPFRAGVKSSPSA